ncbi:hypothetical protein H4J58_06360 [Colwellia sp. MB3u-70]|uniref:hypothetical protein n=1 Tax=unclassified Colwellia TaxID=196834 RepID=UPI0015F59815|nr:MULTISPECIES: hypothetical protein [unclassified Colwellia]MBA6293789.1 hypothetical protein [Colwellia sp. MB3u-8]MBA6306737.1 hypothetical protein [Colwellia sp. MB3u-70]
MKLAFVVTLICFTQAAFAEKYSLAEQYSGCKDPKYITYVDKRLVFYEKLDKDSYEKALNQLSITSFENLNEREKYLFLYSNIVLSARFDSEEVALKNISRFEAIEEIKSKKPFYTKSGDMPHLINITLGWMVLNAGKEKAAISYLLDSTNTNGSPVLGSFGPDKTLIRALYKKGHSNAVLEYLKLSETFWNTEGAKKYIEVWRKMIKNNCAIQFQFYDTTSIEKLGL